MYVSLLQRVIEFYKGVGESGYPGECLIFDKYILVKAILVFYWGWLKKWRGWFLSKGSGYLDRGKVKSWVWKI